MKRRRKRTTHQRHTAKFRARLLANLLDRIGPHAGVGEAYKALTEAVATAIDEMWDRGFTDDDIDKAVKKAWAACSVAYRDWLDRRIRHEARQGRAYALVPCRADAGQNAECPSFLNDINVFIGRQDVLYAVHDAVAAEMRPARRRSDVV